MHLTPHLSGRVVGRSTAVALLAVATIATSAPAESAPPLAARQGAEIQYSDGVPRHARLTIPSLPRITNLRVVAYRGRTDDGPGTRIQNRGIAAAPSARACGIGPGGIGNYRSRADRTSHGGSAGALPTLDKGDKIYVDAGPWRYVYRYSRRVGCRVPLGEVPARTTSRRCRASRAEPKHGYITVSNLRDPRGPRCWQLLEPSQ